MGDYSLSPAEVAALSLGRDAGRPESSFLLLLLTDPWPGELAAPTESGPDDLPWRGIAPSSETDDQLAAFMELLPEELYSLHHPVTPQREQVEGETGHEERLDRPAAVERLERVVVGPPAEVSEYRCCSICLEDMEVGGEARAMGCSHSYHEACILQWLKRSTSCPLCRYQMPIG